MSLHKWTGALALVALLGGVTHADMIVGKGLVSTFDGSFDYKASSATDATLTITLKNTTDPKLGGFLTGFAFNNPSDLITGVKFGSTDSDFVLAGGKSFKDSIPGTPFGFFDIGSGLSGKAKTKDGLAPGMSATFTFTLKGSKLDSLDEKTFFDTLSAKKSKLDLFLVPFAAKYDGYLKILPDVAVGKLVPDPDPDPAGVPEPSSLFLLTVGAIGAGLGWRRSRRTRSTPQAV